MIKTRPFDDSTHGISSIISIHSSALHEKPCMKSVYADPQFYYSGAIYTMHMQDLGLFPYF